MNFKHRSWLRLFLVAMTVLLIGIKHTYGATDWLHCSPTVIRPGDFLRIQVVAAPQATVKVKFLNQTKQLYPVGPQATFIGLAAASYRTVPGKYPMTVTVVNGSKRSTRTQDIKVVARQFVEQRITVSEKKRKATATKDKTAADARVGTAVRKKTGSRHLGLLCKGTFIMPLKGKKTSDFGLIRYVNNIEHGRHSGWDLAGATGTPVAAMNRGRVVFAGKLYASGNTVIIHHGLDLYTSYAHLSKISVKKGSMIKKGQIVGKVGMTGLATGPHLHLTVRVGETPVDPALLVGQKVVWFQ
ncbi:MAG: M23 family metallopeptidase [Bacillota bacterium]|jgi:murein DD-endopeptidase MepM/ murein hydrolase activator NlpD